EEVTMTGLFEKSTNEAGNWVSATFAEVIETTTFTERIVTEIDGVLQTKDAEVIGYNYNGFGMYYLTSILADPTEDRHTVTEAEFTGIVRVTSDEANWWYTTTDILSSYTSTFTINDDFEQATHIVYAFNEDGEWITSTSTHTPESQTRLTTYTTNVDDEEVTITGLFEKSTNEAGNWVSATFAEVIETTTFTERIVTEINGVSQTKDAEVIGYNYNGFGMYYLTSILADPTEARFTVTEADYTGIVRVTSDEENWWYTTTDILSSYTSTYTINDDFEQATHIVYASVNEDGEWITSTSAHTPESQTRLTTYTTNVDDEEVTITGLFEKSTNEAGNWVSATFAEVIETTTFTERIVTEINGVSQTKDAEVIGYNYNGFGMYYLTSILADPTEARFTVTEADFTGIVRVTSDEENWWYTTTDILSSYTSTFTINDDFEQATHIVYASVNEDGEWITSTSTHTPESQTRLTTYTTSVDDEEVTITGLFEKSTNEAGNWVSATFAEVIETTTVTERIVTEIDGALQTKDAEVIGYNYNGFGMYYLTSILADPTEATFTVTEADYTGIVRVTSDEANWWYTTTDVLTFETTSAEIIETTETTNELYVVTGVEESYNIIETTSEISIAETDFIESTSEISIAETEFIETTSEVLIAETEFIETTSEISIAETDFSETTLEVLIAETNILETMSEMLIAETSIIETTSEILIAETDIIETTSEMLIAETSIIETTSEILIAETDIIETTSEISIAETDFIESTSEISIAETEFIETTSEVLIAETEFIETTSEISIAETDFSETTSEVLIAETNIIETTSEISIAETSIIETTSEILIAEPDILETTSEMLIAETNIIETTSEISIAETDFIETTSEMLIAETSIIETTSEILIAETDIIETTSEISIAETDFIETTSEILAETDIIETTSTTTGGIASFTSVESTIIETTESSTYNDTKMDVSTEGGRNLDIFSEETTTIEQSSTILTSQEQITTIAETSTMSTSEDQVSINESTSVVEIVPTEELFVVYAIMEEELETFTTNGTHIKLMDGDPVIFEIDDDILQIANFGYIHVSTSGALEIADIENATRGWAYENGTLTLDFSLLNLFKRADEVEFFACPDESGYYIQINTMNSQACVALDIVIEPVDVVEPTISDVIEMTEPTSTEIIDIITATLDSQESIETSNFVPEETILEESISVAVETPNRTEVPTEETILEESISVAVETSNRTEVPTEETTFETATDNIASIGEISLINEETLSTSESIIQETTLVETVPTPESSLMAMSRDFILESETNTSDEILETESTEKIVINGEETTIIPYLSTMIYWNATTTDDTVTTIAIEDSAGLCTTTSENDSIIPSTTIIDEGLDTFISTTTRSSTDFSISIDTSTAKASDLETSMIVLSQPSNKFDSNHLDQSTNIFTDTSVNTFVQPNSATVKSGQDNTKSSTITTQDKSLTSKTIKVITITSCNSSCQNSLISDNIDFECQDEKCKYTETLSNTIEEIVSTSLVNEIQESQSIISEEGNHTVYAGGSNGFNTIIPSTLISILLILFI
ncbi:hypothetical protein KGF54_001949, partial [Candida jiufengensis]|uniref:uncharacterized protein n=1 Tax=Candida jiufengensis TaxID=497108 RepID=UPI0022247F42